MRCRTPPLVCALASVLADRGEVGAYEVQAYFREWGRLERDESQSVPFPEKRFKTKDLELPFSEGSFPSCSPHSPGCTRTFLHPSFPVANCAAVHIADFVRFLGPAPLQKCVGDFCCANFGGFCRGFSSRIFLEDISPQKWGEKIRQWNRRKNPAAQKWKSATKSVLPKTDPKISPIL